MITKLKPGQAVFWNTGNYYTNGGQIIGALIEGDRTYFADFSRSVSGSIETNNPHLIQSPTDLRAWVERAYCDGSQYRNDGTHQRLAAIWKAQTKVNPLKIEGSSGQPTPKFMNKEYLVDAEEV